MLVFYLYLLARWQHVKRPAFFLLGTLGLLLAFVGRFFAVGGNPGSDIMIVVRIFDVIGSLVAFLGAVVACYGAALPGQLAKVADDLASKAGE